MNIKKGQHVKVIDIGEMYASYNEMAEILGISDYISDYCKKCENEKGIIINFSPHTLNSDVIVVAIYLPKLKQNIMIGTKGLNILPDPIILPDELFEL